jgi:DNA photolyase
MKICYCPDPDNPALVEAIEKARKDKLSLRPTFILDPGIVSYLNVVRNRLRFLQETLRQLDVYQIHSS